jgi:predicted transcriptional regulator
MPETYKFRSVFNGDDSDLRFLDPQNSVIGLYAKGKAKKDTTGFVKYPVIMLKAA